MKRVAIICAALLGAVSSAHATPHKAPLRTAHVSSCIARQRAALAPLDQYGGHLPSMAPALMQEIMNPLIDRMRCTRRDTAGLRMECATEPTSCNSSS